MNRAEVIHRSCIAAGVTCVLIASLLTDFASRDDAALQTTLGVVDQCSTIPARYWAKGSGFPDLAAVYYFGAWLAFPATVGALLCCFHRDRWVEAPAPENHVKAGFGALFLIAIGVMTLWRIDGETALDFPIDTSLSRLILAGWIPFAVAGMFVAIGIHGLRLTLTLSEPNDA